MKLKDYPYRMNKSMREAILWLAKNRRRLEKEKSPYSFDYPDYWGMPKNISSRLSSENVDWIQEEVGEWDLRGDEN